MTPEAKNIVARFNVRNELPLALPKFVVTFDGDARGVVVAARSWSSLRVWDAVKRGSLPVFWDREAEPAMALYHGRPIDGDAVRRYMRRIEPLERWRLRGLFAITLADAPAPVHEGTAITNRAMESLILALQIEQPGWDAAQGLQAAVERGWVVSASGEFEGLHRITDAGFERARALRSGRLERALRWHRAQQQHATMLDAVRTAVARFGVVRIA